MVLGKLRLWAGRNYLHNSRGRWNGAAFEVGAVYAPDPMQVEGELVRAKFAIRVTLTLPSYRRWEAARRFVGELGSFDSSRWTGRRPMHRELTAPRLDIWRWA